MRSASFRATAGLAALGVIVLAASALAGPQHWGFGFGYLVVLEENSGGQRVLSVYEPPLRVKDGDWLVRWRDASGQYAEVVPGGLAVGNFWPQTMGGKEYLVALCDTPDQGLVVRTYDPPEVFSTRAWKVLGTAAPTEEQRAKRIPALLHLGGNRVVASAAGDLLGLGHDQLCVLAVAPGEKQRHSLGIYSPPETPGDGAWTWRVLLGLNELEKLDPTLTGAPDGMAIGDFWGTGQDVVMFSYGPRQVYVEVGEGGRMSLGRGQPAFKIGTAKIVTKSTWPEGVRAGQNAVACDFLKDGFAYLATLDATGPAVAFTIAPRGAERYRTCWVRPDETFAGARLAGQELGQTRRIMTGGRQAHAGRVVALAAGRVFGYITADVDVRKEKLWKPWAYRGFNDVEIAFAHRTPVYRLGVPKEWQDGDWPWEPDDHFGWPHKDEEVIYEISIKNNGKETIPAGQVTLQGWVSTQDRNADIVPTWGDVRSEKPAAGGAISSWQRIRTQMPDFTFTIDQPIPPFDPAKPEYAVVKIPLKWPFELVQPDGWSWKKLNVRDIGERWLVLRADYAADENERNDRYELALHSLLFRPVLRFDVDAPPHPTPEGIEGKPERKINTLAWRAPVVLGDPESKEYYGRKLADAVTCMWERSRTSDGGDVWHRYVFDSYRLYDPQGRGGLKPLNRADDWSFYEAPRENEHWLGLWGDYERFDAPDGGAELHETGHLGHRIGDLYHYFINPIGLRSIRLGDGRPVQMDTYAWGLDSFCSGHAILGEATCDLHRYIEGARYGLGWGWHQMLPERVRIRVLDRDGEPVPDAQVKLWLHPENQQHSAGTTDAQGVWDPQFPAAQPAFRVFEPFNIKLWQSPALDALAQVFTVDLPGYSDFMIWGAEETHAHSRYTLMHESLRNPQGWTWDFRTLYKAGAPEPQFEVTAGVQGRQVKLTISADLPTTYRVYRRWEPTYTFERIAELAVTPDATTAGGRTELTFLDDMGAADWYMKGRYRATYYVTQLTPAGGTAGAPPVESLPKPVYGIAMDKVNSVFDVGDGTGRLLVALNCGKAEPFGVLCQGTTPVEEFVKHFRFGHTAAKLVASRAFWPNRCYATLVASDMPWGADRFFDLIQFDKPDRHESRYPVVQTLAECAVTDFSTTPPYTLTVQPDPDARAAINAGDWVTVDEQRARIVAVAPAEGAVPAGDAAPDALMPGPLVLTLAEPLVTARRDRLHATLEFGGGTAGARAELRELQRPRGLATIRGDDGHEYIVIADTGNGRVVVWDRTTRFVAAWQPAEPGFHPVAVAHSMAPKTDFFVLDRRADRQSRLHHLRLAGRTVEVVEPPLPVDVGERAAGAGEPGPEMGLAVHTEPDTSGQWSAPDGRMHIAVTDAANRRVLEYRPVQSPPGEPQVLTQCRDTFAGDAQLTNPTDVAYTFENGALHLYCVDGHNWVVRLR